MTWDEMRAEQERREAEAAAAEPIEVTVRIPRAAIRRLDAGEHLDDVADLSEATRGLVVAMLLAVWQHSNDARDLANEFARLNGCKRTASRKTCSCGGCCGGSVLYEQEPAGDYIVASLGAALVRQAGTSAELERWFNLAGR